MKTCIIGVGNRWREDDAIGLVIADQLKPLISNEVVDFCLFEKQLFELQSCYGVYHKLVIIDAMPPGAEPGRIEIHRINEPHLIINNAYSLHDLDLLWQLQYMFQNGFKGKLMLIGIETASMGFSDGLTPDLAKVLPKVISRVEKEVLLFLRGV